MEKMSKAAARAARRRFAQKHRPAFEEAFPPLPGTSYNVRQNRYCLVAASTTMMELAVYNAKWHAWEACAARKVDHNQVLAESAAKFLVESGAEHYAGHVFTITLDQGGESFEVVVTTQKVGARSAHDLRMIAEAEVSRLKARLASAQAVAEVQELPAGLGRGLRQYPGILQSLPYGTKLYALPDEVSNEPA